MKWKMTVPQSVLPGMVFLMLAAVALACQVPASGINLDAATEEPQGAAGSTADPQDVPGAKVEPQHTPNLMAEPSRPDPRLFISPNRGGSGTRVTADGMGFPANADIVVYYGPNLEEAYTLVATGIKTDAEGNFRDRFNVPGQWPNGDSIGNSQVFIQAVTADDQWFAWSAFSYRPNVGAD